jgi:hypothetical protein
MRNLLQKLYVTAVLCEIASCKSWVLFMAKLRINPGQVAELYATQSAFAMKVASCASSFPTFSQTFTTTFRRDLSLSLTDLYSTSTVPIRTTSMFLNYLSLNQNGGAR